MKRIHGVLLAAALVSGGCIQGERAIHVNADGSGRIVDTVKMFGPFAEMLKGFQQMDQSPPEEQKAKQEQSLRDGAAKMGPGVSLASFEEAEDGSQKIVYAFEDISKVQIESSPSPAAGGGDDEGGPEGPGSDPYTFRLEKKGSRTHLVIVNPLAPSPEEPEAAEAAELSPEEQAAADMAEGMGEAMGAAGEGMAQMMKPMLAGAHFKTTLTVEGSIAETNSPHRDGSTVTLLEIDFDKLMASPKGMELLSSGDQKPDPELLQEVDGIATSIEPEIVIAFEGK